MKRPFGLVGVAAVALAMLVWTAMAAGTAVAAPAPAAAGSTATAHYTHDCAAAPAAGYASCYAVHRKGGLRTPAAAGTAAAAPQGFGPADLQSAYALDSSAGAGQTVAIVDAQDDPDAEADLATYRAQFGLPACSTANGCFSKVNQSGAQGDYPAPDPGWAGEISLDLDMVSATCPQCHILLVEADSASFADLGAAENTAAARTDIISNSYGGSDASDADYGQFFHHDGVAITASTGDDRYQGASYPASSSSVIAVGGTSLVRDGSARGWSESVWNDAEGGTGSGCSDLNAAIPGSESFDTGCAGRAMSDVSAVADPETGVAVYDSTRPRAGRSTAAPARRRRSSPA